MAGGRKNPPQGFVIPGAMQLPSAGKKWGYFPGGSGAGAGLFSALATASGEASAAVSVDTTNGIMTRFTSGAVSGNGAGRRINNVFCIRKFNPIFRAKLKVTSTSNIRLAAGFCNNADLSSDDPLNGQSGVLVGFRSSDSNFVIMYNGGSGATQIQDLGVAIDTSLHTIQIIADDNNGKYYVIFDGVLYTLSGAANIPGQTTSQTVMWEINTTTTAAKILDVLWVELLQDK